MPVSDKNVTRGITIFSKAISIFSNFLVLRVISRCVSRDFQHSAHSSSLRPFTSFLLLSTVSHPFRVGGNETSGSLVSSLFLSHSLSLLPRSTPFRPFLSPFIPPPHLGPRRSPTRHVKVRLLCRHSANKSIYYNVN